MHKEKIKNKITNRTQLSAGNRKSNTPKTGGAYAVVIIRQAINKRRKLNKQKIIGSCDKKKLKNF